MANLGENLQAINHEGGHNFQYKYQNQWIHDQDKKNMAIVERYLLLGKNIHFVER